MTSREVWQGIAIGTAAAALGVGLWLVRARRRATPWDQASRAVRQGRRWVRRSTARAINQSRAFGRRVLPDALR